MHWQKNAVKNDFSAFSKVLRCQWKSNSPAMVDRSTRVLYLNWPVFSKLKPEHQFFVTKHEEGHAVLNTSSEELADDYAFRAYAKRGFPLTEAVKALTRVLSFNNPEHLQRANKQLNRALEFDGFYNEKQSDMTGTYGNEIDAILSPNEFAEDFLGIGKKARERREEKRARKQADKLARIEARGESAAKGGGIGGFVKGIGQALGLGGSQAPADDAEQRKSLSLDIDDDDEPEKPAIPTWAIVLIIVIALVAIYFLFIKKKKG